MILFEQNINNLKMAAIRSKHVVIFFVITLLTPNNHYSGRTAPITSKVAFYMFVQQI